jgi:hypothetical protein
LYIGTREVFGVDVTILQIIFFFFERV